MTRRSEQEKRREKASREVARRRPPPSGVQGKLAFRARVFAVCLLATVLLGFGVFAVMRPSMPVADPSEPGPIPVKQAVEDPQLAAEKARLRDRFDPPPVPAGPQQAPALSVAGGHHIGSGLVVNIIAVSGEQMRISLLRDPRWKEVEARLRPGSPWAVTSSAVQIGQEYLVNVRSYGRGPEALAWSDNGNQIHVVVGSPWDDRFVRLSHPARYLFLGFGGADTVEYEHPRIGPDLSSDFMLGEGGRPCPLPTQATSPSADAG